MFSSRAKTGMSLRSFKSYKPLGLEDILILSAQINSIVLDPSKNDEYKSNEIKDLLDPSEFYYQPTTMRKIIQANGTENSPLRSAIKLNLFLTFQMLVTFGYDVPTTYDALLKMSGLGQYHVSQACDKTREYSALYKRGLMHHEQTIDEGDEEAVKKLMADNLHCEHHHVQDLIVLMHNRPAFQETLDTLNDFETTEKQILLLIEFVTIIIKDPHRTPDEKARDISLQLYPDLEHPYPDSHISRVVQGNGDKDSPLRLSIKLELLPVCRVLLQTTGINIFSMRFRQLYHSPSEIRSLMGDNPLFVELMTTIKTPAPSPMSSPRHEPIARARSLSVTSNTSSVGASFANLQIGQPLQLRPSVSDGVLPNKFGSQVSLNGMSRSMFGSQTSLPDLQVGPILQAAFSGSEMSLTEYGQFYRQVSNGSTTSSGSTPLQSPTGLSPALGFSRQSSELFAKGKGFGMDEDDDEQAYIEGMARGEYSEQVRMKTAREGGEEEGSKSKMTRLGNGGMGGDTPPAPIDYAKTKLPASMPMLEDGEVPKAASKKHELTMS